MKKSEAAKKIQIFLENRGYCGNCDDGQALVVYLCEELGMLPPPRSRVSKMIGDSSPGFKWEPEDEEK